MYILSLFIFGADTKRTFHFTDLDIKEGLEKRDKNVLSDSLQQVDKNIPNINLKEQIQPRENKYGVSFRDKMIHQPSYHQEKDVNIGHSQARLGERQMKVEDMNRPDLHSVQQVVKPTQDLNAPGEFCGCSFWAATFDVI